MFSPRIIIYFLLIVVNLGSHGALLEQFNESTSGKTASL